MTLTEEQQKAYDAILAGENVFLTGKAGTGKTFIIEEVLKNMENVELVKKEEEIETTTIISKSPKMIQILDPSDYSAVDLEMKEGFEDYNIGEEIKLIKIDDYIYLINARIPWLLHVTDELHKGKGNTFQMLPDEIKITR